MGEDRDQPPIKQTRGRAVTGRAWGTEEVDFIVNALCDDEDNDKNTNDGSSQDQEELPEWPGARSTDLWQAAASAAGPPPPPAALSSEPPTPSSTPSIQKLGRTESAPGRSQARTQSPLHNALHPSAQAVAPPKSAFSSIDVTRFVSRNPFKRGRSHDTILPVRVKREPIQADSSASPSPAPGYSASLSQTASFAAMRTSSANARSSSTSPEPGRASSIAGGIRDMTKSSAKKLKTELPCHDSAPQAPTGSALVKQENSSPTPAVGADSDASQQSMRSSAWSHHEELAILHLVYWFVDRDLRTIAGIVREFGIDRAGRAIDKKIKRMLGFERWNSRVQPRIQEAIRDILNTRNAALGPDALARIYELRVKHTATAYDHL